MNRFYKALERSWLLQTIKNSFISLMPMTIISSIFVLIVNFPIPGISDFMQEHFELVWNTVLPVIPNAFNTFISLYIMIAILFNYSKVKNEDSMLYILSGIFCYFILLPTHSAEDFYSSLDANGIFFSILCSIVAATLLNFFSKYKKKMDMLSSVPKEVLQSFIHLLPLLYTVLVIFLIKIFFVIFHIDNPATFINEMLQKPIMNLGSTLPAVIFINLGITFLWFFGFNGSYIFNSIMNPIYFSLNIENLNNILANKQPENIITGTFQSLYISFGGSGSTLALILAILLFSKDKNKRTVSKLSFIPGIFNINEPIIYGLPVLLNFKLLFPFILCPLINTIVTYVTMYVGIVSKTNGILVPWTTPPIISGFLSSGISGAILQMVLLIINILVYLPFIKNSNKVE